MMSQETAQSMDAHKGILARTYADLLPPLTTEEQAALAASLKADGQREAITVDEHNVILDGHHRAALLKHPKTCIIRGLTEAEKQAFIFQVNLTRRNLSPDQKREALKRMKQVAFALREEDAKKNTQAVVAAMLGVSQPTIASWFTPNIRSDNGRSPRKDTRKSPDARVQIPRSAHPLLVARVDSGASQAQVAADFGVSQQQVGKLVAKEREKQERRKRRDAAPSTNDSSPYQLIVSSIEELHEHIDPDTIDAIITDPPYEQSALPLYEVLARQAAAFLKPGGSLFVMTGQSYLPEIFTAIARHVPYHWTLAYLTPGGQSPQIWPRKINTFWKPILWFVKGTYQGEWHGDVIKSAVNDNDKRFHDWGQSESGMREVIENYTDPHALILDPFLGGGTTGVVALMLGRRFIGAEKDAHALTVAKNRMQESLREQE